MARGRFNGRGLELPTSCIGSLPHTDPSKAVDLVLEKLTSIPFWPQLPNRGFSENMYAQYATRSRGPHRQRAEEGAGRPARLRSRGDLHGHSVG